MIPQISSALSKGFNSKQILDYLIKKFPQYSGRIKDAMAAGFTVDQVLKFISGGKKALAQIEKPNSEGITEQQQMQNRNRSRREEVNKRAIQGAVLAATPMASSLASAALSRALPHSISHVLPDALSSALPTELNQNMPPEQQSQGLLQEVTNQSFPLQPPANPVAASIPEPVNIEQPKEKTSITEKLWNDLDKPTKKSFGFESDAFLKIARRMKSTGEIKSKEDFEKFFNIFDQKKNEGKNLPQALKEASNEFDQQKLGGESQSLPKSTKLVDKPSEFTIVASPEGFGEIKTSRNGKAIIEVEGKKHQVDESKLLKPPKEAAVEALELIKSFTPEQHRSTHHMLNAYEPESKQGFFVFHNGAAYVVDDISEEEYKELSEEIEQAKTTGESIIGKYAAGEGSRGAAYNKIVKGVRDRKVVPEMKKKFKKLQVGYNLLAEWQRLLNEK